MGYIVAVYLSSFYTQHQIHIIRLRKGHFVLRLQNITLCYTKFSRLRYWFGLDNSQIWSDHLFLTLLGKVECKVDGFN